MEKELTVEDGNISGSFFYEDFELSETEQTHYQQNIQYTLSAFRSFLDDEHSINQKINVNITLCSDAYIIELNESQRSKAKVTDVLSFPLQENIRDGEFDSLFPELELSLIHI